MFKTIQLQEVTSIIERILSITDKVVSPYCVYLLGSYADNSFIASSDIDLCFITLKPQEAQSLSQFFRNELLDSKYPLDLTCIDLKSFLNPQLFRLENLLWRETVLNVLLASKLIYGPDIRHKVELPSAESYTQSTFPMPLEFIGRVRGRLSTETTHPVFYPNEKDYYFGYLGTHGNLKLIVSIVGWIATSLLSLKKGPMIGKKSSVVDQYKLHVDDEWTEYIESVFYLCRNRLHYEVPSIEADREAVRKLCRELLSLENYYLNMYEKTFMR